MVTVILSIISMASVKFYRYKHRKETVTKIIPRMPGLPMAPENMESALLNATLLILLCIKNPQ